VATIATDAQCMLVCAEVGRDLGASVWPIVAARASTPFYFGVVLTLPIYLLIRFKFIRVNFLFRHFFLIHAKQALKPH
jgi:hypothetical protein